MKRILILTVIILLFCFALITFRRSQTSSQPNTQKLTVVTTLFPLYDMGKHIGGESVEITLLLPPGVEAHSFEPKPSDIEKINEADVFIYTGKYMEPWVEDILKGITNETLLVVDASQNVTMITPMFHEQDEKSDSYDPHIWLDFANDIIIVREITDAFGKKDPEHISTYVKNGQTYSNTLENLDIAYKNALSTCQKRDIIFGGHFAFGYLTRRYNLTYQAAQGISPDSEPTARDLIALVDQIRKSSIDTVFFEELTSPKIAETLARETNSQLLLLNAGHNISKIDFDTGKTFFAIMEENLVNLTIGLQCD